MERIPYVESHHVFGLMQGDGGKLGEAGNAGPPGQRVSEFISKDFLSLAFDNKELTGRWSYRGRMERMATRELQVQLVHP